MVQTVYMTSTQLIPPYQQYNKRYIKENQKHFTSLITLIDLLQIYATRKRKATTKEGIKVGKVYSL